MYPCALSEIREFIEIHHYSHSVNGVKISFCFGVNLEGVLVGGIIFGSLSTTAWKRFSDSEKKVVELRRLVLLDCAGKNSESRVIGWSLRWLRKNAPSIKTVVSYADPKQGHSGIIYRASNFKYRGVGPTDKGYRDRKTGKIYHSRALRTRYKGHYKPFVVRLRGLLDSGGLEIIPLPGKHCYTYEL